MNKKKGTCIERERRVVGKEKERLSKNTETFRNTQRTKAEKQRQIEESQETDKKAEAERRGRKREVVLIHPNHCETA
jgi:hypothetical protein